MMKVPDTITDIHKGRKQLKVGFTRRDLEFIRVMADSTLDVSINKTVRRDAMAVLRKVDRAIAKLGEKAR